MAHGPIVIADPPLPAVPAPKANCLLSRQSLRPPSLPPPRWPCIPTRTHLCLFGGEGPTRRCPARSARPRVSKLPEWAGGRARAAACARPAGGGSEVGHFWGRPRPPSPSLSFIFCSLKKRPGLAKCDR